MINKTNMDIEDIKDNYYFETLNENHDLSYFDCGDEELNDFLKNDALKQQNSKLNVTKLVVYKEKIIGYFSLLTDTLIFRNIRDENVSSEIKKKLQIQRKNRTLPAVKIGRLAIDKKYSGNNLRTHIIRNII